MSLTSNSFTLTVASASSALTTLAASLSAGQWGSLTMSGLDSTWVGGGDSFLSFGPIGQWDSAHNRLVYIGATHPNSGGAYETREFYCDTSSGDTWVRNNSVIPPGDGSEDHGYYHMACDPATGDLYRKRYGVESVSRKPWGGSWSTIATPNLDDWNLAVGSLVWHPGLHSGNGGLILATYEGFDTWNPGTNSWTVRRQVSDTMGTSANHNAVYNRADQCAYFFNESKAWKVTAAGAVSAVAAPPLSPTVANINSGGCVYSSTGSNRMVMMASAANGKTIYEYNHTTNAWASIGTYPFSYSNSFAGFTADSLGCLVFIMTTSSNNIGTTVHVWKR